MESSMQAAFTTLLETNTKPLRRLDANIPWESELEWGCLDQSPWCQPPLPRGPTLLSDAWNLKYKWPSLGPLFPMCLDMADSYPTQERELLITMFQWYHSSSIGYSLSSARHCFWIHFDSEDSDFGHSQSE